MKLPKIFIGPAPELRRPRFPVSRELVSKQLRAAEALPPNSVKPIYVEDQPYEQCTTWAVDANGSPLDEFYGPIG